MGEAMNTHGHAARGSRRSPTYVSYRAMLTRCLNSNRDRYDDWGGRGITICPQWIGPRGFETFLADMGERPLDPEGWAGWRHYFTLDRVDNDGPYSPENCRWAPLPEQAKNKRRYNVVRIERCRRAGHPYDDANTYINKSGERICRACARERRARK